MERRKNQRVYIFAWGFWACLTVIAGYLFYLSYLQNPCKVPVSYAIGSVDPRFKVTADQVLGSSNDAAKRWNVAEGKNVLIYDPKSVLKINLVYDDRQGKIDKITSEAGALDTSGNAIDTLRTKLDALLKVYEKDLASYDGEVNYWNARGGAPADIYNRLQKEKSSLDARRESINRSAEILNQQVDQHNSNLNKLNGEIEADKNKIITQGEYDPNTRSINIYTFGNQDELRLVVMHELGHALSMGHDSIAQSIMYPILGEQSLADPKPSAEDLQMFNTTCRSVSNALKSFLTNFSAISKPTS